MQTVQIQVSWLIKKPTDLDLHCLQNKGISGFSMRRVKNYHIYPKYWDTITTYNTSLKKEENNEQPIYEDTIFTVCFGTDRQAWANSADPDEMLQNTASHDGLHCLPLIQQFLDTTSGSKLLLCKV